MGRVKAEMNINGHRCWTLFDSGSRNTYIVRDAVHDLPVKDLPAPRSSSLGGRVHEIGQVCLLYGSIEEHWVETNASILDEIGSDEDGRRIEVLFGAVAMQLWGLKLDLQNEQLDFAHYTTDFVEF